MRAGECCVGVWCCLGQLCRSAVLSRPALGREGEDRQLFYPVASALQYFGNISTINTSLFMPIEVYSSQKHHYISQYNSISTWPPDISHCALVQTKRETVLWLAEIMILLHHFTPPHTRKPPLYHEDTAKGKQCYLELYINGVRELA